MIHPAAVFGSSLDLLQIIRVLAGQRPSVSSGVQTFSALVLASGDGNNDAAKCPWGHAYRTGREPSAKEACHFTACSSRPLRRANGGLARPSRQDASAFNPRQEGACSCQRLGSWRRPSARRGAACKVRLSRNLLISRAISALRTPPKPGPTPPDQSDVQSSTLALQTHQRRSAVGLP